MNTEMCWIVNIFISAWYHSIHYYTTHDELGNYVFLKKSDLGWNIMEQLDPFSDGKNGMDLDSKLPQLKIIVMTRLKI